MRPRGLNVTPWVGDLWDPSGCSSWLWDGATPPHPLTPGSGACLLGRERGVCGWPEPAAWNAGGPCNEQLSHPKEKQAHLQKPRGARWGLGTGCEGGASWSAFPLSQGGKLGQQGCGQSPSLRRASAGLRGERTGKHLEEGSSGDTVQRRGLAGNEHFAGRQETPPPTPSRLRSVLGPSRGPQPGLSFPHCPAAGVPGLGCSLVGEGVTASQYEPRA